MARKALERLQKIGWVTVIRDTFTEWSEDKAPRLGAALAYYTVFSLAPLLIVVVAIAGFVFGEQAAQGQLSGQLTNVFGKTGAQAIEDMLTNAHMNKGTGIFATVVGVVTLLLGASGVFGQLKAALNTIWGVEKKPGGGIKGFIRDRVLSFGMVLVIGFLLLVSLLVSVMLSTIAAFFENILPIPAGAMHLLDIGVSMAVVTILFALIFRVLPDVKIAWSNVWIGAIATALLFTIGKFVIGLYLGKSSVASAYGPASSIVVILLWVYYSAQILFLGAEFTQVYAKFRGVPVQPSEHAIPIEEAMCDADGNPKPRRAKAASPKLSEDSGPQAKRERPTAPPLQPAHVFNAARPAPETRVGEPLIKLLPQFLLAKASRRVISRVDRHA